jgi:recombinational DNA repair ATPase RecF
MSKIDLRRVYVDGFKNIRKTTLSLDNPITILLAPNSYGKTNMLDAIRYAANLIGMGEIEQRRAIAQNRYTDSSSHEAFSFEIEFYHDDMPVIYSFAISPSKRVERELLKAGGGNVFHRIGDTVTVGVDETGS